MADIPDSHPRKSSLLARAKLVQAAAEGLLAESAMIAHGRGEAFDYMLGEETSDSAKKSIQEAAARLLEANNPVISMNGNSTVLAGKHAIRAASIIGCPVEVNIYYRTEERMAKLITTLESWKNEIAKEDPRANRVEILGSEADGRIRGLKGPRALCSSRGIEMADVILVPLEDGDRCEALIDQGKQVIAVDLNPLSRTARMATVTIVDEVTRAMKTLCEILNERPESTNWNNKQNLREALKIMSQASERV
tara:strand:+ start:21961 stop:22713 length:753 start_codon:yes stop_codon:yes gene_type:complete